MEVRLLTAEILLMVKNTSALDACRGALTMEGRLLTAKVLLTVKNSSSLDSSSAEALSQWKCVCSQQRFCPS